MSASLSRSSAEVPVVSRGSIDSYWRSPLRLSLLLHGSFLCVVVVPVIAWRWFSPSPPETVAIEFREIVKARPESVPSIRASESARVAPGSAVFGASRRSLRTDAAEAPAVRTGNTVTKEEDDRTLTDADPDALPSPVEDYLVERMPEVLADVRVPYPPDAKARGVQGAVTLELLVDVDGNVRHATILDGPGYGLNEAALEAAKRFRFRPAVADGGKAVPVKIRYAYRFVLER